jgi:hypothetical protein
MRARQGFSYSVSRGVVVILGVECTTSSDVRVVLEVLSATRKQKGCFKWI